MHEQEIKTIVKLISKSRHTPLSSKELRILNTWLHKSFENQLLFDELTNDKAINKHLAYIYQQKEKTPQAWDKVDRELKAYRADSNPLQVKRYVIAAATVILVGFLSLIVYNTYQSDKEIHTKNAFTTHKENTDSYNPGSNKGTLILSDGQKIELKEDTSTFMDFSGTQIIAQKGELDYSVKNNSTEITETIYNTLIVPKTGIYSLVLSDGSKVWLNSNSSLKFPVQFVENHRTVYLQGEAYFDVSSNADQPFTVVVDDTYKVQALGTSFNINSYSPRFRTILTEGKVQVSAGGQSKTLSPHQQATLYDGQLVQESADIEEATAWKNGYFYFKNQTLSSIMDEIARWYDIQVSLPQDNLNKTYSGTISRQVKLEEVLLMLNKVSLLHFHLENGKVTVSKVNL